MDAYRPWGIDPKQFRTLMHVAQFGNFLVPFLGTILPLLMWMTEKERDAEIDLHGRIILNWQFSACLYGIISLALIFVAVGFLTTVILAIVCIVYAIMGAVKANEGVAWPYPFCIDFMGVKGRLAAPAQA